MATIDNLDISASYAYAVRIALLEEVNQRLRLKEAGRVTNDVTIVAHDPMYSEFELALGLTSRPRPYASFVQPDSFTAARRDSFTSYSVCPSFGTLEDHKNYISAIESATCQTTQDQAEQATLGNLMGQMATINGWLQHIWNRVGQYLKG
jgi:hypothetical protein